MPVAPGYRSFAFNATGVYPQVKLQGKKVKTFIFCAQREFQLLIDTTAEHVGESKWRPAGSRHYGAFAMIIDLINEKLHLAIWVVAVLNGSPKKKLTLLGVA